MLMIRHFAGLFLLLLFLGCSPSKQLEKRYTVDDKMVFDLLDRLKKNPQDAEAARLLPEAYRQAAEVRKNINKNTFNNMSEGDRWLEISRQLQVAEQLYSDIKANAAASKVIPDPWNPTVRIQEAKQKAAEEYYNQAQQYLTYNNRPYAQKAYDMFSKANSAYPGYKDVRRQMDIALELATIKVVVRPVNYYNYGWNYWGFDNDYLQYRMVQDLNNGSYRNVRFYTDNQAAASRIQPDRVVELNFDDLYIGTVYNDNYSVRRSKQVQTGETKSNPPQPVYTTVTATVYVNRRILQSRALLECRIYDRPSQRLILSDRFRDDYTWKQESGRYTGDSRALDASDWAIINNNSQLYPPSRNELVRRLIDNCYNQLLSRIRSGVSFDN